MVRVARRSALTSDARCGCRAPQAKSRTSHEPSAASHPTRSRRRRETSTSVVPLVAGWGSRRRDRTATPGPALHVSARSRASHQARGGRQDGAGSGEQGWDHDAARLSGAWGSEDQDRVLRIGRHPTPSRREPEERSTAEPTHVLPHRLPWLPGLDEAVRHVLCGGALLTREVAHQQHIEDQDPDR
jgi:hypothetical protein